METVGILAVQGAFIEHERKLSELGCTCVELRQASDLLRSLDRLVLPGGESTVQSKLLHELGMFDQMKRFIEGGIPVMGTCAGLILLARRIEAEQGAPTSSEVAVEGFATLPIAVQRNAYGRQLGSFHATSSLTDGTTLPLTFIRAPRITALEQDVEVLARCNDDAVAVRFGTQLATTFHPELDAGYALHQLFLSLC